MDIIHAFPLPVDVTDQSSRVTAVSGETVQFIVASTNVNDAGSPAGTLVYGRLVNGGILDSSQSRIGNANDTSFSWGTGTCFTTIKELNYILFRMLTGQLLSRANLLSELLANYANGEYSIDHQTGIIYGRKATVATTDTASYSYRSIGIVAVSSTSTLEVTPSNLLNGRKTVTVAGTAVPLTAASTPVLGVTIKALRTNTNNIYVGTSSVTSANGLILRRGASVSLAFDNLTDVYINADTSGEGVTYLAVNT